MLILTRHPGETVHIGDDVLVTIINVQGKKVRIGISAPDAVPVHRKEVYDRIKAEKAEGQTP